MNPEVIAKLLEAVALSQRHADKTLHLAARATATSTWTGHYGINMDYSNIVYGPHQSVLATVITTQHRDDTLYLVRSAKRSILTAEHDLAVGAAIRQLAASYETEQDPQIAWGKWVALHLLAQAYGIEADQ